MQTLTILNFSARNDGNCASIANYIKDLNANSNICIYNIFEQIDPCSNCNYECLKPTGVCPGLEQIKPMMDQIMNSETIYYIVPNYCGFPSANYFTFNERKIGYFQSDRALMGQYMNIPKKFIVVSNTEDITFYKAVQQQAKDPQILYLKTSKYGKQSLAGDILDSEAAKSDLNAFLA